MTSSYISRVAFSSPLCGWRLRSTGVGNDAATSSDTHMSWGDNGLVKSLEALRLLSCETWRCRDGVCLGVLRVGSSNVLPLRVCAVELGSSGTNSDDMTSGIAIFFLFLGLLFDERKRSARRDRNANHANCMLC